MIIAGMKNGTMTVPCGTMEPIETLTRRSNVMVARSVVNTCANEIPLRLLNPSDDQVIIYKETTAATLVAIGPELSVPGGHKGDTKLKCKDCPGKEVRSRRHCSTKSLGRPISKILIASY